MRNRTLPQPCLNLASALPQPCLSIASALPQLHHDMTVFVTSTETEIPQAKTIIHLIYIYYRRAPALYIHCCNNNIPLWQIAHMWWHSRILDTLESLYAIAYIYSHSEFAFRNPYKSQQYTKNGKMVLILFPNCSEQLPEQEIKSPMLLALPHFFIPSK